MIFLIYQTLEQCISFRSNLRSLYRNEFTGFEARTFFSPLITYSHFGKLPLTCIPPGLKKCTKDPTVPYCASWLFEKSQKANGTVSLYNGPYKSSFGSTHYIFGTSQSGQSAMVFSSIMSNGEIVSLSSFGNFTNVNLTTVEHDTIGGFWLSGSFESM